MRCRRIRSDAPSVFRSVSGIGPVAPPGPWHPDWSSMRRPAMSFGRRFALLVGLQVVLVLSLVAWKQWTVTTGQTIWLRSAPMDPRDLFRG
ncbi:MAG: GDYXXLXY domain-containing protein, partial [Armatimonadaceae bacterium]